MSDSDLKFATDFVAKSSDDVSQEDSKKSAEENDPRSSEKAAGEEIEIPTYF